MSETPDANQVLMKDIVELCKRRGFIFHSSEIYGGIQGVYDYGPLGVELKNNLKAQWWNDMVYKRDDIEGLDASILTHNLTLKYSGHESTFSDPLVDCKNCKVRLRADLLKNNKCSECGSENLTSPREFNLMFKCKFGPIDGDENFVYLRPETAQSIFINFKNVINTSSKKLPFGIAQIGKSFRNEITARNFIFRTREFEQMELEFFVNKEDSEKWYRMWIAERLSWWVKQGLSEKNLKTFEPKKDELAHYSVGTCDILYKYLHGFDELEGIANRADYDLASHSKNSDQLNIDSKVMLNKDSCQTLSIHTTENEIFPYVIEPSAGVDRGVLALLIEAYTKELLPDGKERIVLKLARHLAPFKMSIIPVVKNKHEIVNKAKTIASAIRKVGIGRIKYEDTSNIGKAYRKNDEIGTPFCVTVDFETMSNETVTIRDRDTMLQQRISISDLLLMVRTRSIYDLRFD